MADEERRARVWLGDQEITEFLSAAHLTVTPWQADLLAKVPPAGRIGPLLPPKQFSVSWLGYDPELFDLITGLSYEEYVGPIPPGAEVLHSCDNRPCIEPTHLRAGNQKQNAADMVARERNPRYLPLAVVDEMYRRFARGEPDSVVANALELPKGTVSARRFRWRSKTC